ncbi:hypothetical protein WKI13_13235 [Teredinibacter turnerae]|uniref:hypothetical protein n=1 Tax=Teredinibacter turnerae TaxID=2426 RepID=UPI000477F528|nr:hypothetical protein [Teredinibacter turnerae]
MIEILIGFLSFSFLVLGIIGVIVLIPVWVKASTESERDENHIYRIFWEEAGFRGQKILSASGCLFPFVMLARPSFDIEGIVLCFVIAIACGFYHSSIYRGYPVLTKSMKYGGVASLLFLTGISFLVRSQTLSGFFLVYSIMFIGLLWGGYAVYRRAQLIRITRL